MQFVQVLGAPWLGHGRATEAMLAIVCLLYGTLLFIWPIEVAWDSQVTRDFVWHGYARLAAIPFLLKWFFTSYGLLANIKDWPFSRCSRLAGALVGSFIWTWLITRSILADVPFTFGSVCSMVFLLMSIRIVGMTLSGLPRPGAPGVL